MSSKEESFEISSWSRDSSNTITPSSGKHERGQDGVHGINATHNGETNKANHDTVDGFAALKVAIRRCAQFCDVDEKQHNDQDSHDTQHQRKRCVVGADEFFKRIAFHQFFEDITVWRYFPCGQRYSIKHD